MRWFRFHREMLDESMATRTQVADRDALYKLLREKLTYPFTYTEIVDMEIKFYAFDDRINEECWMVLLNYELNSKSERWPVGFLDGPL